MKRKHFFIILLVFFLLWIFICFSFFISQLFLKNSPAYDTAIDYIKNDTEVIYECGEYVSHNSIVFGSLEQETVNGISTGNAEYIITFTTNKGKYKITIYLTKNDENWSIVDHKVKR
ncbi:MAG: hypothetical protein E7568_04725 [Ruminococcaceae bacterium]|nr:hypothetical protein [Oscillospiraceae bacterium]